MGIGTFNLMISLLPPRIIKLLEFIGFGGNKDLGLIELEKGFALHQSLRQVCSSTSFRHCAKTDFTLITKNLASILL